MSPLYLGTIHRSNACRGSHVWLSREDARSYAREPRTLTVPHPLFCAEKPTRELLTKSEGHSRDAGGDGSSLSESEIRKLLIEREKARERSPL